VGGGEKKTLRGGRRWAVPNHGRFAGAGEEETSTPKEKHPTRKGPDRRARRGDKVRGEEG